MDENMNSQTSQTVDNGEDSYVQDSNSSKGKKLFTQEEVNSFVQSQVGRMMKKVSKEQEEAYSKKLEELNAREMKLLVKERLNDRGMPRELADIITCADENDLNAKLDALQKIYGNSAKKEEKPAGFVQVGGYNPADGSTYTGPDPIRKAMGLKG